MNKYVGAPYNFVPITEKIYKRYQKEEDLPRHDKIDTKRYSGELHCKVTAMTDIFIGGTDTSQSGGYSSFAHDMNGVPCIPGSSMKGLVRSNMQVLGFGSIAGDVEDYSIMYRQVGSAKSKVARYYSNNILDVKSVLSGTGKNGKQIRTTVPKNVKAGYIRKEGKSYVIYPTEIDVIDKRQFGECNYYPVSELEVFRAKEDAENHGKVNPFSFFEELNIQMQHKNSCKGSDFKVNNSNGRTHVKGPDNLNYVPYAASILYQLKGNRKVVSIIKNSGTIEEGYQEGYVISTGKMREKKVFYVVPKMKNKNSIQIPESDVLSFKRDFDNKKNMLHGTLKDPDLRKKCKKFFALPEEGEVKPVFYVKRGKKTYFGYTPFFRIFFEHPVLCGVSKEQRAYLKENGDLKKAALDYPAVLLGYATDKSSYKSRVNFEDFRLQIPENKNISQYVKEKQYKVEIVQGEPKLSSYWDYLVQNNPEHAMTYNEDNFELRGLKQYWLHEVVHKGQVKNEKMASKFWSLKKNVVFLGKVRFQNLSADELGLLIWSLSLETDSNQNIGRAKAFGYGRIDLKLEHLLLYDYKKMYGATALCMDVFEEKAPEEINQFVRDYKDYMNQNYMKNGNIMDEKGINALLKMKNKNHIPEEKYISYMSLDNRDYQNRNQPLHTIDQVLNREIPKAIWENQGKDKKPNSHYKGPRGENACIPK